MSAFSCIRHRNKYLACPSPSLLPIPAPGPRSSPAKADYLLPQFQPPLHSTRLRHRPRRLRFDCNSINQQETRLHDIVRLAVSRVGGDHMGTYSADDTGCACLATLAWRSFRGPLPVARSPSEAVSRPRFSVIRRLAAILSITVGSSLGHTALNILPRRILSRRRHRGTIKALASSSLSATTTSQVVAQHTKTQSNRQQNNLDDRLQR